MELNTSFRTTQPVLNVVDEFFNQHSVFQSKHRAFRDGSGIVAKFPIIAKKENSSKSEGWAFPNTDADIEVASETLLAKNIANTICSWIKNKRLLSGYNRVITAKDILILIRKRGPIQNSLVRELKAKNINVISQQSSLLKKEQAIFNRP